MPAELVPNGIRVQAVFQGQSGLPEDRYVNTFHFMSESPVTEAHLEEASRRIDDFYTEFANAQGQTIAGYLATGAFDVDASHLRAYNLELPDPRVPYITPFTNLVSAESTSLPSEVAVCLSFYSLQNVPSRRGRVYLGPLDLTVAQTTGGRTAHIVPAVATQFAAHCTVLAEKSIGPLAWAVLGHPGGGPAVLYEVTNGWIDDAFDTQRRRGEAAQNRVAWSIADG